MLTQQRIPIADGSQLPARHGPRFSHGQQHLGAFFGHAAHTTVKRIAAVHTWAGESKAAEATRGVH